MAKLHIDLTMEYKPEGGGFHVTGDMGVHGDAADTATLLAIAVGHVLDNLDLSPDQFLTWMRVVNAFPREGVAIDTAGAARQAAQENDP
ncbi:MAG: hypothetical protein LIO70_06875 [Clostridiales bacterium]|nr:hypothetical protein [Clostridiales bacterium]